MTPQDALVRLAEAEPELAARAPSPFPLPLGRLAPVVAGTVTALERADWWVPGMRDRVGAVLRDVPLDRLVDGFRGARPYRIGPPGGSAALRALYGVGLALARRDADDGGRVVVSLGVGSLSDGATHEALNLAALNELPMVFVVAVPPDEPTPFARQWAADLDGWASSFGASVTEADGADAVAVNEAVRAARGTNQLSVVRAVLAATKESS